MIMQPCVSSCLWDDSTEFLINLNYITWPNDDTGDMYAGDTCVGDIYASLGLVESGLKGASGSLASRIKL